MNRPRRAALGNSEPPFALPAGAPAPPLPLSRGGGEGSSPLKPPGSLPPSFVFPPGPAVLGGVWSGRARLPELPQAAFTRGIAAFGPVPPLGPGPRWEMRHLRRAGLLSHDRDIYRDIYIFLTYSSVHLKWRFTDKYKERCPGGGRPARPLLARSGGATRR